MLLLRFSLSDWCGWVVTGVAAARGRRGGTCRPAVRAGGTATAAGKNHGGGAWLKNPGQPVHRVAGYGCRTAARAGKPGLCRTLSVTGVLRSLTPRSGTGRKLAGRWRGGGGEPAQRGADPGHEDHRIHSRGRTVVSQVDLIVQMRAGGVPRAAGDADDVSGHDVLTLNDGGAGEQMAVAGDDDPARPARVGVLDVDVPAFSAPSETTRRIISVDGAWTAGPYVKAAVRHASMRCTYDPGRIPVERTPAARCAWGRTLCHLRAVFEVGGRWRWVRLPGGVGAGSLRSRLGAL